MGVEDAHRPRQLLEDGLDLRRLQPHPTRHEPEEVVLEVVEDHDDIVPTVLALLVHDVVDANHVGVVHFPKVDDLAVVGNAESVVGVLQ